MPRRHVVGSSRARVVRRTFRTCAMFAVLGSVASPAGAQIEVRSQIQVQRQTVDPSVAPNTVTLTGTVRDATGRPIVGAEARVDQRRAALSDTAGRFALPGVPFGTMTLVVRRIGYERATLELAPERPGVRIELAVRLTTASFTLPSVLVEGKAYDKGLWDAGFYKRQRVGNGTYFDPDFLQHYGGASLATLAREVPRVNVSRFGSQEYAYGRIAGNVCRMNIYVDGVFRRDAMTAMGSDESVDKGIGLNVLVPKEEIYAVEVYPTINSCPRSSPESARQPAPVSAPHRVFHLAPVAIRAHSGTRSSSTTTPPAARS